MKKILLSLPAVLLMAACVQVPMTTVDVPTPTGTLRIRAPKDSKITGLKANVDKGTISLDSYEARMNPEVISASAAGQAELVKAYGDLANSMAQMGIRAFAMSQGIPLGGSVGGVTQPQPTQGTITTDQLNALIEQRAQQRAQQIVAANTNVPNATVTTNRAAPRTPRNRPTPTTNAPPSAPTP